MKAMRSIWKGHIRFSLVTIPVRVYNAVDSAQSISFNQLHRECSGRVGYDKRCKKCGETLKSEDIVKGYEYEPDQYVLVESEDLEKLRLKSTRIIEIEGFVDSSEVHPTLFDAPYFAGPDGEVASKTYALLGAAMRESGKIGVGKVVLRDREDPVVIAPQGEGIVLYRLRYPQEVRAIDDVPGVEGGKADKEQLGLAKSLIDSMTRPFADIELKDQYRDALREIIQAKVDGEEVVTVAEEEPQVVDIMTALKQSIEQAKAQKKPMVKATGAKAAAPGKKTAKARPASRKRKQASG
jgi:DNA end-binding protein Ku